MMRKQLARHGSTYLNNIPWAWQTPRQRQFASRPCHITLLVTRELNFQLPCLPCSSLTVFAFRRTRAPPFAQHPCATVAAHWCCLNPFSFLFFCGCLLHLLSTEHTPCAPFSTHLTRCTSRNLRFIYPKFGCTANSKPPLTNL
jgi:hypothetical protein